MLGYYNSLQGKCFHWIILWWECWIIIKLDASLHWDHGRQFICIVLSVISTNHKIGWMIYLLKNCFVSKGWVSLVWIFAEWCWQRATSGGVQLLPIFLLHPEVIEHYETSWIPILSENLLSSKLFWPAFCFSFESWKVVIRLLRPCWQFSSLCCQLLRHGSDVVTLEPAASTDHSHSQIISLSCKPGCLPACDLSRLHGWN